MNDGRLFTEWRSDVRVNEYIKYINNVVCDNDYRMLLQAKGKQFMDNDWNYNVKNAKCDQYRNNIHKYPTRTLPHLFREEMKAYNDMMANRVPKSNVKIGEDSRMFVDAIELKDVTDDREKTKFVPGSIDDTDIEYNSYEKMLSTCGADTMLSSDK
jgi:hypothetical protein